MAPLYLRYKNNAGDPWTDAPPLASSVPGQAAGSLPLADFKLQTAPQTETPCGCPDGSATDDHYIMRPLIAGLPETPAKSILTFLLNYKLAAFHEAKYSLYGQGNFMPAELTLLEAREQNGLVHIKFRLAVPIANAL
jgi:hypothetical protein